MKRIFSYYFPRRPLEIHFKMNNNEYCHFLFVNIYFRSGVIEVSIFLLMTTRGVRIGFGPNFTCSDRIVVVFSVGLDFGSFFRRIESD